MADETPRPPAAAPPEPQPDTPEAAPAQAVLPLDDLETPVPYQLTARARRLVAPESLPELTVVNIEDPHDPRPARARALRRGGASPAAIARELGVDVVLVRGWIGDIGHARPRRRLAAVPVRPATHPTAHGTAGPVAGPAEDDDDRAQRHAELTAARAAAANEVGARLRDPGFVRGLALCAATADIDEHTLVVTTRDVDVAATVTRWLVRDAGLDHRDLRVVLRVGDFAGSDLVARRWADALGVDASAVGRTQWRSAPSPDAVEALVRAADPFVGARVAGWRDVLLASDLHSPGVPEAVF